MLVNYNNTSIAMMQVFKPFFLCLLIAELDDPTMTAEAKGGSLGRGKLYSTAAVNEICPIAQRLTASTGLEVQNSIISEWSEFVFSDAFPYSVVDDLDFTYDVSGNPNLPLTTTQHVIDGLYGTGQRSYPQVVSCKMKSAEYLVESALDEDAEDKTCKEVHEFFVTEVMESLTNKEMADCVIEPDYAIETDEDLTASWTVGFPDTPFPVIYKESLDGPIHIQAGSLLVKPDPREVIFFIPGGPVTLFDVCNDSSGTLPFANGCQPKKWGVRYCHFASPEYIREALTGGVDVPIIPPST